jgi:hypothetical protein
MFLALILSSVLALADDSVILGEFKGQGLYRMEKTSTVIGGILEYRCNFSFNLYFEGDEIEYPFAYYECPNQAWNDTPYRMKVVGSDLLLIKPDGTLGEKVGRKLNDGLSIELLTTKKEIHNQRNCDLTWEKREFELQNTSVITFKETSPGSYKVERNFHREWVEWENVTADCPKGMILSKGYADITFSGQATKN